MGVCVDGAKSGSPGSGVGWRPRRRFTTWRRKTGDCIRMRAEAVEGYSYCSRSGRLRLLPPNLLMGRLLMLGEKRLLTA